MTGVKEIPDPTRKRKKKYPLAFGIVLYLLASWLVAEVGVLCMYLCMYVCMYVCIYLSIYLLISSITNGSHLI